MIDDYLTIAATEMLRELREQKLKVIIKDDLRIVVSQNPKWYREFCASYTKWRRNRDRTIIKRYLVIRTLERIAEGNIKQTTYLERLMPVIEQVIQENT